ncbi:hypothetical protein CPC08DRAFT_771574 [Agrocybe pediades]|nr:hypothetical protein CPC08DRAFT_771574 [Agrocybe pediades]
MEEATKAKKTVFVGGISDDNDEAVLYETFSTQPRPTVNSKGKITGKGTSLNGLFKDDSSDPDLKLIGKFETIPPKGDRVESTKVNIYFYWPGSSEEDSVASVEGDLNEEFEPYTVIGKATLERV